MEKTVFAVDKDETHKISRFVGEFVAVFPLTYTNKADDSGNDRSVQEDVNVYRVFIVANYNSYGYWPQFVMHKRITDNHAACSMQI